jgi:hypothetical protein
VFFHHKGNIMILDSLSLPDTDNQSWLASKVRRQRTQIKRLEALVAASKDKDLAQRCVSAEGAIMYFREKLFSGRETIYVKGYRTGYMEALKRHGIDAP